MQPFVLTQGIRVENMFSILIEKERMNTEERQVMVAMKSQPISREQAERVIETWSDTVYKLAFAQMRNRSDADDVYQEVFLRYVRNHPAFESPEHEKAWLLRVTLNCCKKLWAAPWRRHDVPLEETIQADTPENHYLTEELKRLPQKYSAVLHLFYWEDMTIDEISRLLELRPGTVKSRLSRGREMMRENMKGENGHAGT